MQPKKKILIFTDCYIYGGSERLMTFLLKNEILSDRFNLFFGYRKYKDYEMGLENDGLIDQGNFYPLYLLSNSSLFHKINCYKLSNLFSSLLKAPFFLVELLGIYSFWNLFVLVKLLYTVKPDIIHINNGGYPGARTCNLMVLANFFTAKSKIIYQVNNQALKREKFFDRYFDNFINKNVIYFINASLIAKEQLISKRNFDRAKILLVDNCVPFPKVNITRAQIFKELNIPLDGFLIVQVAFLSERKGQRYLIEAMYELYKIVKISTQKVFCVFVGNGEDEAFLKSLVIKLKLESNIFFLGYRNNSEDYISACDLFVLPSIRDEDMPLVLLTALGLGKPIIATDFAGISQVIKPNFNGILLSHKLDSIVTNLVNAISDLYENEFKRISLGSNAEKSYVNYSPQAYGIKMLNIYEQCLKR